MKAAMRMFSFALAVLAASTAVSANAQSSGYYASIFGGASFARDADIDVSVPGPASLSGEMEFDTGWSAGIAAGHSWENGFAIEGEFSLTRNYFDRETLTGIGTIGIDGEIDTYALMINGYYHFDIESRITPYLGAGAGAALMDVSVLAAGSTDTFRDSDVQFAYQAIAGLSYALSPKTNLGVEYRYFGTRNPSFTDDPDGGGNVTANFEHQNHNVLLKLIYRFGG